MAVDTADAYGLPITSESAKKVAMPALAEGQIGQRHGAAGAAGARDVPQLSRTVERHRRPATGLILATILFSVPSAMGIAVARISMRPMHALSELGPSWSRPFDKSRKVLWRSRFSETTNPRAWRLPSAAPRFKPD